mmetsp:Transcript_29028/g.41049  ORF Transcript_29028/g.41049 Transcript_29028/m.41049 type:complete len:278 (-) Transcript_29028:146-979(-)
MKFISLACVIIGAVSAFSPASPKAFVKSNNNNVARFMAEDPVPFFASQETTSKQEEAAPVITDEMSFEDEVEALVQEEVKKTKRASNLRNENGVDYAPWMGISEEDEKEIRQIMKEKAAARRKREEQERSVSGNLYFDSQSQELSGTGLKTKIMGGGDIELEWATSQEKSTKGFIVKRRPAKTSEFQVIASYENWGPLLSKGSDGGVYRYLDTDMAPGGWVYRITECDTSGSESDICQCLVEIQSEDEQKAAVFAAVGIVILAIGAVAAGILLDPLQ